MDIPHEVPADGDSRNEAGARVLPKVIVKRHVFASRRSGIETLPLGAVDDIGNHPEDPGWLYGRTIAAFKLKTTGAEFRKNERRSPVLTSVGAVKIYLDRSPVQLEAIDYQLTTPISKDDTDAMGELWSALRADLGGCYFVTYNGLKYDFPTLNELLCWEEHKGSVNVDAQIDLLVSRRAYQGAITPQSLSLRNLLQQEGLLPYDVFPAGCSTGLRDALNIARLFIAYLDKHPSMFQASTALGFYEVQKKHKAHQDRWYVRRQDRQALIDDTRWADLDPWDHDPWDQDSW